MERGERQLCDVCGNDQEAGSPACRFCGADLTGEAVFKAKPAVLHRRVNLERGRPNVETALKRLDLEMKRARTECVRVLSLIHGYGSSGRGGIIRVECRRALAYLAQPGKLNSVINGEDFNRRSGAGKELLRRFPELEQLCSSDFNNPGITIVVL